MNKHYLNDQRGVAMVLELVLIAAVLGLVGLAVYQSSQHAAAPSTSTKQTAGASSAAGLASSAAAIGEAESTADANLSASAETSADQLTEADTDITNLGGSSADTF